MIAQIEGVLYRLVCTKRIIARGFKNATGSLDQARLMQKLSKMFFFGQLLHF
jgi:hypothetical protein